MPPLWVTSPDLPRPRDAQTTTCSSPAATVASKPQDTRALLDRVALGEQGPGQGEVGLLRAAYASDNKAEVDRYLDALATSAAWRSA
jgi:hypothetical protein